MLCWYSLLTKCQVNNFFQSQVIRLVVKVSKLDVCGRPLFTNPVTYSFRQITFLNISNLDALVDHVVVCTSPFSDCSIKVLYSLKITYRAI